MKKFVLTVALLALCASPVFAQVGGPAFYADAAGTSCNITVPTGVPFNVYVVHSSIGGATGGQWMFDPTTIDPNLTYIGGSAGPAAILVIGSPQAGVSLAYGGCVNGALHVWTFNFFSVAGVPACTYLELLHDPAAQTPGVISVDCIFAEISVDPGEGIMNANASCDCVVAAQTTTWGKVKSLYR
jgi:hypothetical protein